MIVESPSGTLSPGLGHRPAATCRLLLVEDDPSDAVLIEQALLAVSGRDFEISWANRLRSGLERLATQQFDCALLDLTLPDSSGFETLSRMATYAPELPIVVLTGLRDERTILAAVREGGAQDCLDKRDLEGDLLWRTIQYAMDRKRIERDHLATRAQPVSILLVEDDPGDVFLTREALVSNLVHNEVVSVSDGVEAMAYLRREAPYEDVPRPDLVLLDLNLPRMSGREVLVELKQDPELRSIPVVILSTSTSEADILGSYQNHANLYVSKPLDLAEFFAALRRLDDFFISVVKLPGGDD